MRTWPAPQQLKSGTQQTLLCSHRSLQWRCWSCTCIPSSSDYESLELNFPPSTSQAVTINNITFGNSVCPVCLLFGFLGGLQNNCNCAVNLSVWFESVCVCVCVLFNMSNVLFMSETPTQTRFFHSQSQPLFYVVSALTPIPNSVCVSVAATLSHFAIQSSIIIRSLTALNCQTKHFSQPQ